MSQENNLLFDEIFARYPLDVEITATSETSTEDVEAWLESQGITYFDFDITPTDQMKIMDFSTIDALIVRYGEIFNFDIGVYFRNPEHAMLCRLSWT